MFCTVSMCKFFQLVNMKEFCGQCEEYFPVYHVLRNVLICSILERSSLPCICLLASRCPSSMPYNLAPIKAAVGQELAINIRLVCLLQNMPSQLFYWFLSLILRILLVTSSFSNCALDHCKYEAKHSTVARPNAPACRSQGA